MDNAKGPTVFALGWQKQISAVWQWFWSASLDSSFKKQGAHISHDGRVDQDGTHTTQYYQRPALYYSEYA